MEKCQLGLKNYQHFLDGLESKYLQLSVDPSIVRVDFSVTELDDPDYFSEEECDDDDDDDYDGEDCCSSDEAIESDTEDTIEDKLDHTLLSNVDTPTKKPEEMRLQNKSIGKSLYKQVLMLNGQFKSKSSKQLSYSQQGEDGYSKKEISNIMSGPICKSNVKISSLQLSKFGLENKVGNSDLPYKSVSIDYQTKHHLMSLKILVKSSKWLKYCDNQVNSLKKVTEIKPCLDNLSDHIEEYPKYIKSNCPSDKSNTVSNTRTARALDILDMPQSNTQTIRQHSEVAITNKYNWCKPTNDENKHGNIRARPTDHGTIYMSSDNRSKETRNQNLTDACRKKQWPRNCDGTSIKIKQNEKGNHKENITKKHASPITNSTTEKMDERFHSTIKVVTNSKDDLLGMPLIPHTNFQAIKEARTYSDSCEIINPSRSSLKRKRDRQSNQQLNSRRHKRLRILESDSSDSDY